MGRKVFPKTPEHRLPGFAFHQAVFQGEQDGRLHGIEGGNLECAVRIHEMRFQVVFRFGQHRLVFSGVAARGEGHVPHHAGVDGPVGGGQEIPVGHLVRVGDALVTEPVGILRVAVLAGQGGMVILGLGDKVHETLHRVPVLVHDGPVAELFPDGPGDDDPGIGPAQAHGVPAERAGRAYAREGAGPALRIPHVPHPLAEEGIGAGEEGSRLGKHLGISHPAVALIPLRAVRGDGEVVRELAPPGVGDQPVHGFVAGSEGAGFLLFRDRGYRDGGNGFEPDFTCGRDGDVPVAVEGEAGIEPRPDRRTAEGIFQPEPVAGLVTEIAPVDASFRPVHTPALRAVPVVEHFPGKAGKSRSLSRFEPEIRYRGRILPEVHDKRLARHQDDGFPVPVFPVDHDGSVFHILLLFRIDRTLHVLPDIGPDGFQREVPAQVHFGPFRREDFAGEFGVDNGRLAGVSNGIFRKDGGLIGLAVKDSGMRDGSAHGGRPVLRIRSQDFPVPIGIDDFQDAAEGGSFPDHVVVPPGRHDPVRPPAGRDRGGQLIVRAGFLAIVFRDVVGERPPGLPHMREPRLEEFLPNA